MVTSFLSPSSRLTCLAAIIFQPEHSTVTSYSVCPFDEMSYLSVVEVFVRPTPPANSSGTITTVSSDSSSFNDTVASLPGPWLTGWRLLSTHLTNTINRQGWGFFGSSGLTIGLGSGRSITFSGSGGGGGGATGHVTFGLGAECDSDARVLPTFLTNSLKLLFFLGGLLLTWFPVVKIPKHSRCT